MTPAQNEIFDCIFKKKSPDEGQQQRVHIMTHTQFGKSDVVSMAVLTRVATFGEKWVLVAPSQPKARIIIGFCIRHIFDNEYTVSRFKIREGENMEAIRRERSKNRLTFDVGNNQIGEIFILSAESRLKHAEDMGNALMGFGAPNLVEDEAALISDESDAKAMRMVGGFTGTGRDFVVKIGNPFTRGHFLKAFESKDYYKINVDWRQGVKEKNEYGEVRLTEKFVEEMKQKPYFRVLYENKFPEADEIDSKGWTPFLLEDEVRMAIFRGGDDIKHIGEKRIGNDVARGKGNDTVWVLRSMNYGEVLAKSRQDNLTDIAAQTIFQATENKVLYENVFIDDAGVGGGAVDPLRYQQKNVRAVNVAQRALQESKFRNLRAEAYWRLREWIKRGGKLCTCHTDDWMLLAKIKYRPDSKGRLMVMGKDDMRGLGMDSPDAVDALMLTFTRAEHGELEGRRRKRAEKRKKHSFGRGLKVSMGGY